MAKRRILPDELTVGSIVPSDVYDVRGRLLLRQGCEVVSSTQIERLIQDGLFTDPDPKPVRVRPAYDPGPSAVWPILEARRRLEHLCGPDTGAGDFEEQILRLGDLVTAACRLSQDAVLATAIFQRHGRYSIRHSLDVAVMCQVVGSAFGLDDETLGSTVAAALTMNLSILSLQDELQSQQEPLTDEQRATIQEHPERSAAMLRDRGVTDPVWLSAVVAHHEMLDGSGYRSGCRGDDIPIPAQLVALADIYCARISSRKYRRALRPNAALQAIFLDKGTKVSQDLANLFIKAIGVFPAGTPVRLANGEIAVVTSRGEKATAPQVCSILAPEGMPLCKPLRRDTNDPACRVREVMEWSEVGAMPSMQLLWGKAGAIS